MSRYNIGKFTERVTVNYITSETATDMGGRVQNTASVDLMADVKQESAERKARLGANVDDDTFVFTMRNEVPGRVYNLFWEGEKFNVVGPVSDKKERFLVIRAKR